MASPHEAVLDAVEALVRALDLAGWQERVVRFALLGPDTRAKMPGFPCVAVSPLGTERSETGDSKKESYSYPVTLRLLARYPEDDPGVLPALLGNRRKVRDSLQKVRLALVGFPVAYRCLLSPSPVIEAEAGAFHLLSSPLVFGVSVLETRP